MPLSNTLAQLRKQNNMTQEDLAKQIDVSRQTIIAIEKGNYVPSLLLAMKISSVFDTTVETIFQLNNE